MVGDLELGRGPFDDRRQCGIVRVRDGREQVMGSMRVGAACQQGREEAGRAPIDRGHERVLGPVMCYASVLVKFRELRLLGEMRAD